MEKLVSEAELDFVENTIEGKIAHMRLTRIDKELEGFLEAVDKYESVLESDNRPIEENQLYRDYQLEQRNLNHFLDSRERIRMQINNPRKVAKLTLTERIRSFLRVKNAFERYLGAQEEF